MDATDVLESIAQRDSRCDENIYSHRKNYFISRFLKFSHKHSTSSVSLPSA